MTITAAKLIVQVDATTGAAVSALNTLEDKLRKVAGTGSNVGQIFAGVFGANLVSGAISGFRNMAGEALNTYANYERLGMSLQSLTARELLNTGAANSMADAYAAAGPKAQELLEWTQKLAIESPFTQDDIAQSFRMAEAYGFGADESKRLTQALVDFAAGSGATGAVMQQIALALGQIQAKGQLAGQEVLQLVNAGLPVNQILAKAFGKTTSEIVEMRERGLIPANEAIEAIVKSLEEDFGGAAARQSETFSGLISSLQEIKATGLREFFTSTFQAIQPYVKEFVDSFKSGELIANIRGIGDAFGEWITKAGVTIGGIVEWWRELDDGTRKLIMALGALAVLRGPIFGLFADLAGGAASLIRTLGGLPAVLGAAREGLAAWRAGMTLTTSLGVAGFTPLTLALGGVTAALGVGAIAWTAYNAQVVKNKQSALEAAAAWKVYWQAQSGGTSAQIVEGYIAEYTKLAEKTKQDNWFGWVSMGLKEQIGDWEKVGQQILTTSNSYEEYRAALEKIASTYNLVIDAQGNLVKYDASVAKGNLDGLHSTVQLNYAYDEQRYYLLQLANEYKDYVDGPLREAIQQQEEGANTAVGMSEAYYDVAAAVRKAMEEQKAWNEQVAKSALEAGLSGQLQDAIDKYKAGLLELQPQIEQIQRDWAAATAPQAMGVQQFGGKEKWDEIAALQEQAAATKVNLSDLMQRAGELTTKETELANAFREATAQMIYQQAAAGLTAEASIDLARALGMLSESDYAVSVTISGLKKDISETGDGVINTTSEIDAFAQAMTNLQQAIANLTAANLPVTVENIKTELGKLAGVEPFDPTKFYDDIDPASIKGKFTDIKTGAVTELKTVVSEAQKTAEQTKAAFTQGDWRAIGHGMAAGIAAGIGQSNAVQEAARNAVRDAIAAAQAEAGIRSPSQEFADQVGQPMMAGMAQGIYTGAGMPLAAVADVTRAMPITGQSTTVNIDASINNQIDLYDLAYEVARIIKK